MIDYEVRGAEEFFRLSKALKAAGKTTLRKELNKGLKDATKPLIAKTRAATSRLPQSGGLAARVRKSKQTVQVRTGAATAGVRIVAGAKGSGALGADKGTVRHPVFGGSAFVSQTVPSGWFSDTLADSAPTVRPEVEKAIQSVIDQVVREAG